MVLDLLSTKIQYFVFQSFHFHLNPRMSHIALYKFQSKVLHILHVCARLHIRTSLGDKDVKSVGRLRE
jgi:hypothetical protein